MGDVFAGFIAIIGRFLLHIIVDIVLEIFVKGTGYLIVRPFNRTVDPDGMLVAFVGIVFWLTVAGFAASLLT